LASGDDDNEDNRKVTVDDEKDTDIDE